MLPEHDEYVLQMTVYHHNYHTTSGKILVYCHPDMSGNVMLD